MSAFDAKSMFQPEHEFRSDLEIRESIQTSRNYHGEDPSRANLLMIFSTSKQRTYLVATELRMYCVLDDNRKEAPHVNWSLPRDQVAADDAPILQVETRSKTDKTGLVDLGPKHKQWLYSKGLFGEESIEEKVAGLVEQSMIKKMF